VKAYKPCGPNISLDEWAQSHLHERA